MKLESASEGKVAIQHSWYEALLPSASRSTRQAEVTETYPSSVNLNKARELRTQL